MNKIFVGLVAFGLVLGAGAIFLQHESLAEMRGEVALLRADVQQLAKRNDEQSRLRTATAEPQTRAVGSETPALARTDEDRAELAKLREEVAVLKKNTQEIARVAQATAQSAGQSIVPVKLIPANEWKNAGRATPSAAVETLLWAAVGGDVDTMAGMIVLDPSARTKAEALFARLPEATRAEYGSPEKLVSLFLAKDAAAVSGLQILGQRDVTPDVVGVRVRLANEEGKTKEHSFGFQKTPDGLRLKIPDELVTKYAQQLTGGAGK